MRRARVNSPLAADAAAHGSTMAQVSPLRVLVADDDAGSRRFLRDGLRLLNAHTRACDNGRTALQLARAERFDLLLLDCRMPGAGALQILTLLRADAQALSADSMAVATTAELPSGEGPRLLAAGFSEILVKPCTLTDLRHVLSLPGHHDMAVLDDGAALITTGDAATMHALRQLFRKELALLHQELDKLSGDRAGFGDRLHRLRSSCGFCGAATLSTQTALLQQQLAQANGAPLSLARFRQALLATLEALDR